MQLNVSAGFRLELLAAFITAVVWKTDIRVSKRSSAFIFREALFSYFLSFIPSTFLHRGIPQISVVKLLIISSLPYFTSVIYSLESHCHSATYSILLTLASIHRELLRSLLLFSLLITYTTCVYTQKHTVICPSMDIIVYH
jgi:hypothetical protein